MEKEFLHEIGNVYRLKVPFESVYTSVFLVIDNDFKYLIDCATTEEDVDGYIIPALSKKGLTLSDIDAIIISHKHEDHAGGLKTILKRNPNLKVIDKVCQLSKGVEIYPIPGHTIDCLGLLDLESKTLITCDGLQGAGIGKYRCSVYYRQEYLQVIEKIRNDKRIENLIFSHEYEPWYKNHAFGCESVDKCLSDCVECIYKGEIK